VGGVLYVKRVKLGDYCYFKFIAFSHGHSLCCSNSKYYHIIYYAAIASFIYDQNIEHCTIWKFKCIKIDFSKQKYDD